MIFVNNSRGGREVNMINTLSKINLSKIRLEGGRSTSIWIMSLNILFFLFFFRVPLSINPPADKHLKLPLPHILLLSYLAPLPFNTLLPCTPLFHNPLIPFTPLSRHSPTLHPSLSPLSYLAPLSFTALLPCVPLFHTSPTLHHFLSPLS